MFLTLHQAPARHRQAPLSHAILLSLVLATLAGTATAQPVVNPRIVEFDPSADHAATLADGTPAVDRYDFELYMAGATAPFHTVNLGKPTPESDGKIRVDFSTQVASWPLPGGTYESRVGAVGPGGTGRSTVSNQFQFTTGCTYTVGTSSVSVAAGASTGNSVAVTTTAGCAWTATTATSWITLTTATGTGSGALVFSAAANPNTASRTGTITVAGQTITVTQAAASCSYTLSPGSASVPADQTEGNQVLLETQAGCAWTASTSASWITLNSTSGSGPATIVYNVSANTGTSERTDTVTVAGQAFTVTQAAPPCDCSLSTAMVSVAASASSGNSVAVAASGGCRWNATTKASWVTLNTASGAGDGSLVFSVAANKSQSSRSAAVQVGTETLTVHQAAAGSPGSPKKIKLTVSGEP
jgi:hypothetical protein